MSKLKAEDVLEYFHTVTLAEAELILRMAVKTVAERKPLSAPKKRGPRKVNNAALGFPGQEAKAAD